MSDKDDEVDKILSEFKFAKGDEPQPSDDEKAQNTDFKLNEKENSGFSVVKNTDEPTQQQKISEQPEENEKSERNGTPEKSDSVEAIESDLKKARETEDDSDKPQLPFSPEKVDPNGENYADEYPEEDGYMKNSKNKKIIIAVVSVVAAIAIVVGICVGASRNKKEPETETLPMSSTTTEAPIVIKNPLTGEIDYNDSAVGERPVAVVVENSPQARPQYNMDSPDIIVEGEVEGGITRMLWLYADMTDLPEQVGPTRSARPSFVQFSQFFDCLYVHFGQSHSKGDYEGADDYIKNNNVDNIDGMSTSSCFKRTKDKVSPHNAVLLGNELVAAIEKKGYRTDIDSSRFTQFAFNEKATAVSQSPCSSITGKFSNRASSAYNHTFTYDSADGKYKNQSDFKQEVSFENVVMLMAESEYVDKHDYKGSGKTETYCNYKFTSGTGKLASAGTVVDFSWKEDNGKLVFTDASGNELKLNPGKTWIGFISSNNGGAVEVQ